MPFRRKKRMCRGRLGLICLASGASSRFGADKLAAPWQGRPLGEAALRLLETPPFCPRVLVSDRPFLLKNVPEGCIAQKNPSPALGQAYSLRLGLSAMPGDVLGALIFMADQPLLQGACLQALADAFLKDPSKIVAAAANGVQKSPVVFPARFFRELTALQGDEGGRKVICRHREALCLVETDPAQLFDVDTKEDLALLEELAEK